MIEMAHDHNIPVLIDGAQAVPHMAVDLKELDCDFYTFSSHKCYGPTGIGVLYAKSEYLEQMIPYQSGGSMIETVDFDQVSYLAAPYKFEAGTPHIAGVIGLAAAIDYLTTIGYPAMMNCEQELLRYANEQLSQINDLRLIGTAADKTGVISFTIDTIHPHDIASILDREGIAIRAGHHCSQPLMKQLGINATARVSLAFYNTREDIKQLVHALKKTKEIFKR